MSYELAAILITVIFQALYIAYKLGKFEEKLNILERKQDKHNNVIERQYHLESRVDVQDEKIEVANHRIDDLEGVLK
jgi:hypothetical protein